MGRQGPGADTVRVIIFDDLYSFFHFILGALTPLLGTWGLTVTAVYLIYQYFDKDKPEEKAGDIVEFLLGAGGWALIHTITSVL